MFTALATTSAMAATETAGLVLLEPGADPDRLTAAPGCAA